MPKVNLRKIEPADQKHFAAWWKNKELIKLTSGDFQKFSAKEVAKYFTAILKNKKDHHFIITLDDAVIGHLALSKRNNGWHETQIVIGYKKYWNKGYGTKAIKLLLAKAKKLKIKNIYLVVRPSNTRAIKAYEKCGFVKTAELIDLKDKNLPRVLRMELK